MSESKLKDEKAKIKKFWSTSLKILEDAEKAVQYLEHVSVTCPRESLSYDLNEEIDKVMRKTEDLVVILDKGAQQKALDEVRLDEKLYQISKVTEEIKEELRKCKELEEELKIPKKIV